MSEKLATHVYKNGMILTMDSRSSFVPCLAVRDDRIVAVGSESEVAPYVGPDTKVTDLQGRFMMPGFYDGHSHFMRAGMHSRYWVDINSFPIGDVRSFDDIKRKIAEACAKAKPGEWILCSGYDDTNVVEHRHFTLAELDEIAPVNPLFLRHISGHLAVANSLAFAEAGITRETLNPEGGVFQRDADGNLTGLIEEPTAMDMVLAASPQMTDEMWQCAVESATEDYIAKGVTTAHDGGVTTPIWRNYMASYKRGLLKNRIQLLPKHGWFDFSLAPTTKCGESLTPDHKLSMGAVKIFQDGSLQGYTGYLTNPYITSPAGSNDDLWRGYPIRSRQALVDLVTHYHKQGWQVAIHCNGDACIDDVLEAYEGAQKAYPRANARDIAIHCQTVREDQLDRIARVGVVPSFFVTHTYFWGDRHRDIFLGEYRASRISPLRSALKRRIPFTLHNDTMVTPIDPLMSVWSAVNRLTSSGKVLGPAQRIDVIDALKAITIWGAYQFHEEHYKGSLEPGKLADMVILDANPLVIDPVKIKDIKVLATIVGDKCVYGEV